MFFELVNQCLGKVICKYPERFIIPGKNKWNLKKPSKNIPTTFSSKVNEISHKSKVPDNNVNVYFSLANTA